MKKKEDSFIGTQFPTPKGGTLTIKEVYSSGKHPKYICTCSICSIDKEMFPYGSIIGDKSILRNGGCCCGCSKSSRWNEDQNYIRVKRKCSETGYIFHGWYGEYNKSKTYLDLENPETGNRWNSTNLDSFLRGCGDPIGGLESRKRSRAKSIDQHLKSFYEAGIKEDYILWVKDDQCLPYYYWCYICPVCSYDEYVKSGVCSGVFESHYKSLKKGALSCRCSSCYRWTQEQREYRIKKICKEEGFTFIGWGTKEGYKNALSKFEWLCARNHKCSTPVDSFLSGTRCRDCGFLKTKENSYGNGYGYYPERRDEKDYLYILNFNDRYIKVGRSFNLHQRFNQLARKSKIIREDTTILQIYTDTHQTIYDTEQWLHEELRERGFEYNEDDGLWSTELFDLDCTGALSYLLNQVDLKVCENNITA